MNIQTFTASTPSIARNEVVTDATQTQQNDSSDNLQELITLSTELSNEADGQVNETVANEKKTRSNSSPVWEYATIIEVNGVKSIKCQSCDYSLKWCNSTASMANHLRDKHLKVVDRPLTTPKRGDDDQIKRNRVKLAHIFLLKFLITSFLPFRVVENKYFVRFLNLINENYVLPSRRWLSSVLLNKLYDTSVDNIKQIIVN
jgi:hypothetical protein